MEASVSVGCADGLAYVAAMTAKTASRAVRAPPTPISSSPKIRRRIRARRRRGALVLARSPAQKGHRPDARCADSVVPVFTIGAQRLRRGRERDEQHDQPVEGEDEVERSDPQLFFRTNHLPLLRPPAPWRRARSTPAGDPRRPT